MRGCHKQKYSEACRPILGKHTDGLAGTLIDLMAVFALLAGTTTTFTLATPLMSQIVSELFGFGDTCASSPSRFWQSPAWYIPFPSCVA
ncbi:MAG: BCCT family transporter [Clostridium fessum]